LKVETVIMSPEVDFISPKAISPGNVAYKTLCFGRLHPPYFVTFSIGGYM
jgi:hypothetical protein